MNFKTQIIILTSIIVAGIILFLVLVLTSRSTVTTSDQSISDISQVESNSQNINLNQYGISFVLPKAYLAEAGLLNDLDQNTKVIFSAASNKDSIIGLYYTDSTRDKSSIKIKSVDDYLNFDKHLPIEDSSTVAKTYAAPDGSHVERTASEIKSLGENEYLVRNLTMTSPDNSQTQSTRHYMFIQNNKSFLIIFITFNPLDQKTSEYDSIVSSIKIN